mmetsp:Transcript_3001/g.9056  ORF Transcript_3001/g.9056 Transcript_3001/m.9056 type:complete len:321 (-) Transcript_3001:1262-2224(-)
MRVVVNVVECVFEIRHLRQDVSGVAQTLGLEVQQHLLARTLRILNDLVNQHTLDLQVPEGADVCIGQDRLLGQQSSDDVHPSLLHDGEEVGVVAGPAHVPDILALKLQLCSDSSFSARFLVGLPDQHARGAPALDLDVIEGQHAVDVDDGHPGAVAVRGDNLRPAADGEARLDAEVRQGVALHHAGFAGHKEALLRGGDAGDGVLGRGHGRHEALLVMQASAWGKRLVDVEHHLRAPLVAAKHACQLAVAAGMLGDTVPVHPDVHDVLGGNDDVRVRHRNMDRLDVEVLRVDRAADVVAHDDDVLSARVVGLRDQNAKLV